MCSLGPVNCNDDDDDDDDVDDNNIGLCTKLERSLAVRVEQTKLERIRS